MTALPECASHADLERLDGHEAAVIGTYVQVDVRFRQKPPPVHRGHAAVRLADGSLVHIEPVWSPEAIRPSEEITRSDGRAVRVTGVVHLRAPEPEEPTATVVSPCVSGVKAVDLL